MATVGVIADDRTKRHADEETQGLEKVTDYVEEKELTVELGRAFHAINEDMARAKEEKVKRDRELAKVTIRKEEVELIMRELEISKTAAERSLREHKGDLIKALHSLTN